ncbi:MAG: dihydropteroate synthase [Gammaproteobacteria bacterium]|nr:MAG: dihydropteroate synthase [Gammaproteobacteria bacterium]
MAAVINSKDKLLNLSTLSIMGILNITPDSFSDGGKFAQIDAALAQVEQMIVDGASIIDIGGESTRPDAKEVSIEDELARVIPLLKAVKERFNVVVSIDTSKAEVMGAAIEQGADIINDVRALQNNNCLAVLAQSDIPVCLMHMQGLPRTMQQQPCYNDLINNIKQFFEQRIQACEQAGINKQRLILDVGFGFGKTLAQNYQLLANMKQFKSFNLPLLSGTSRKSMIGNLLHCDVQQRMVGSIATAIIAAQQGANILRVHDVKETMDAIKVLQATVQYSLLTEEK